MKYLLALCMAALCCFSSAQTTEPSQTTPNLIDPTKWTGQSVSGQFGGANVRDHVFGCCTGGPGAAVDTSGGGTIWFSWGYSTVAQTIAINQALQGSGIKVSGLAYSYDWYNYGYNRGSLSASINVTGNAGNSIESYQWSHAPSETDGWKTNAGTKTFTNPYTLSKLGTVTMSFTGQDDRFWAGYYGPAIANPSLKLTYGADQCVVDPLSSPSCPGYAQAYFDQQCTANPLYNSQCPGYAQAYFTQQCTANPLFSPQCPGYAQAYFDQQCTANPLYSPQCPGYAKAYFDQQCSLNGLYDRTCPNYAEAYAKTNLLSTTTTTTTTITATTSTSTTTQLSSGIADPTVSTTVTAAKETTSTTSPTSVISPISVVAPPKTAATESAIASVSIVAPPTAAQQQERQQDQKKTDGAVATVERRVGGNRAEAARQVAAAAKDAAEKSKNATTIEAQVANQGMVVGLMGYVPGFSAYQNAIVPDVLAQTVARQYMKPPVDNRNNQRALSGANEQRWNDMVNMQYK